MAGRHGAQDTGGAEVEMKFTTAVVLVAVAGSAAYIAYSLNKAASECSIFNPLACLPGDRPVEPAPMTLGV